MNYEALNFAGYHGVAADALLGVSQVQTVDVTETRPSTRAARGAGLVVITGAPLYSGTLEADITATATTANFLGLPADTAPEYFRIGSEIVLATAQPTAGVPKTVNIVRSQWGSTAAAKTAGVLVEELWQFVLLNGEERNDLVDGDTMLVVNASDAPGLVRYRMTGGSSNFNEGAYVAEGACAEFAWYERRTEQSDDKNIGQWYRLNVRENTYD